MPGDVINTAEHITQKTRSSRVGTAPFNAMATYPAQLLCLIEHRWPCCHTLTARLGFIKRGGAFMQKHAITKEPVATYKEVRIGKTIYRVTSVFSGEKDLGKTLEQLAVRRAMSELDAPAASQPCHAS